MTKFSLGSPIHNDLDMGPIGPDCKPVKSLDQIACECGTDRASVFTRTYGKPHDYAKHYDKLFSHLRNGPVHLLEIGVGGGEGVRMWQSYFWHCESEVIGVDSQANTNPWDNEKLTPNYGYQFVQGNQGHPDFWEKFAKLHGEDGFDIILDDGSHVNTDIITTFIALWPHVKLGGFYAIEDLNTSYDKGGFFVKPSLPSQMEFLKGKLDELNHGQGGIDSIYWAKELCVLRKASQ